MKKDAYYFSHDSNAKDDPKIIKLRIKLGWEGYGLFWALIEMLRDQESYKLETDYESIAFALRVDTKIIQEIVTNFSLFKIEDGFFYSESLLERMQLREEKSDKARDAANKRWNKSNANAMQTHSESNANPMQLKESKGKEIKGNESKENDLHKKPLDVNWIKQEFYKEGINSMPFFHRMSQAHSLSESRILAHFEKWSAVNEGRNMDLQFCKNSFNKYLEGILRDDLDDPNLPSNKYPKSTLKDNWW